MMDEDQFEGSGEKIAEDVPKASYDAKLQELLHYVTSMEIKLCADATKEFIKLLKSGHGGHLLHKYVQTSPKFTELLEAWKLRRGKPGISYIFKLISALLSHPDGKYRQFDASSTVVHRALDKFSRLVVDEKLDDIYKELDSKEAKRQNAALQLMASIVRRGSDLASEVAKKFDFKSQGFHKLCVYKKKQIDVKRKYSTRNSLVGFAMSFLEVGKPGLLRWILQQKDMYSSVLRGLGNDDDEIVVHILSTLRDRILTKESLVPPGLRSVLFGSVTLEKLISISGRENGGLAAELAHGILLIVCTDPSSGLMPDIKRGTNTLKGNAARLVGLIKKLRAAELKNHRDLLLAIVHGRPLFGSAYMEEFPYNVEDHASPLWFSVASLAADVVSSVGSGSPFGFLDSASRDSPSLNSVDVQNVMRSVCPHSYCRSGMNKGLLHSDFLVKNGTLRLLLEALKLLDSFVGALSHCSCASDRDMQTWETLKQEIRNEIRTLLPDPQVLVTLLSTLNSNSGKSGQNKRTPDSELHGSNSVKKLKTDNVHDDGDIIVSGISLSPKAGLSGKSEKNVGTGDESGDENSFANIFAEIWGLDQSHVPVSTMQEAEIYFYSRLVDALQIYLHMMPTVLDGSFEFFVSLLRDALELPTNLLNSFLTLLKEYIRLAPASGLPRKIPVLMYKHLQTFMYLVLFSPIRSIRDQSYDLSVAAMLSTGAFDRNPREVNAWFLFLPGFNDNNCSLVLQQTKVLPTLSQAVISFLADAISTVGNNLFKYWDSVRNLVNNSNDLKDYSDVSPSFSPLAVCILQKCLRVLKSESGSFSSCEKTMLSLYVCSTLKYVLQTQVDAGCLSAALVSLLSGSIDNCSNMVDGSGDIPAEWGPPRSLLLFAESILQGQTCCSFASYEKATPADSSFLGTLDKMKISMRRCQTIERVGITERFSSSIMCASPKLIVEHFPAVVTIAQDISGVSWSFLTSLFFLEHNLLADVFRLWPEMVIRAVKMVLVNVGSEGRKDDAGGVCSQSFHSEEPNSGGGTGASESSSVALSFLLGQIPFHVLFPAILCFDNPSLADSLEMKKLLLQKASQVNLECLLSYMHYVLFWIHQLQLSTGSMPPVQLRKSFELCISLLYHILSQLLNSKLNSGFPEKDELIPLPDYVQEAVGCIFSHPALTVSLTCPLGCNEMLAREDVLENFIETFDLSSKRSLEIDFCGFGLPGAVSAFFLSLVENHSSFINVETGATRQLVKGFESLVHRLLIGFKNVLNLCIQTLNFRPLLPTYRALNTLNRLISPFEAFKLVWSVFNIIDLKDTTISESCRKSIVYIGCHFAANAFESLGIYLQQQTNKRSQYDSLWRTRDQHFNADIIEDIYLKVFELSSLYETDITDICLLKAITAACRLKSVQHLNVHPLSSVLLRVIVSTPAQMVSYCISGMSMMRAKALFLLTQLSPLHLSIFGCVLSGILTPEGNLKSTNNCRGLSNEDFLMLLPTTLSFMDSIFLRYGKQCYWNFRYIPLFYSSILLNGFCEWKSFVSKFVFQEGYGEFTVTSADELLNFVKNSSLGKAVHMLHYHFVLDADSLNIKKQMELFDSVLPDGESHNDLLDCDWRDLNSHSVKEILNLTNGVLAKILLCRMLLFPSDNRTEPLTNKAPEYSNENSQVIKAGLESSRIRFLCILVSSWEQIVKRSRLDSTSEKEKNRECESLYKYLEELMLRSIFELIKEMHDYLVQLKFIPFMRQLIRTCLLYRFEDPITLNLLRNILTPLCKGQFSCAPYLQLLLAHSQFPSILHSIPELSHSLQLGAFLRPMSSILRSVAVPRISKKDQESNKHSVKRLEVLQLLRTLIHFSFNGCGSEIDSGNEDGINFQRLHSFILYSYGGTLGESDLELFNLLQEIDCSGGSELVKLTDTNYLWGSAALKVMKVWDLEQNLSSDVMTDTETDEYRRLQFRENLPIDPKLCALTVLDFPYNRATHEEPSFLNKVQINNSKDVIHIPAIERKQRYDPVFILQFSLHILPIGFIDPVEFAGLGLLAVAFSCLSSLDDGIRRLAYQTLASFKIALEKCQKKKDIVHLRLLLNYVQNGIEEPWQRIPSVIAVFAAEASLILLDPSNDHYPTLSKLLMHSSRVNMKSVPMFHEFLWSSSVNFRAERIWILRLVYVGLGNDDDALVFMRNSVFENLLSLYASPFSDNESKELILQIVRKSVRLRKMACHLVEHCGLFSWLSSALSHINEMLSGDEKGFYFDQLVVILEVISNIISSRNITEWLQKHALEQLSEVSSHLFKFLSHKAKLLRENTLVIHLILQILVTTLKISQKRKIFQPHFTLAIEGLFHIYDAIKLCDGTQAFPSSEFGLRSILMNAPPPSIIDVDEEKLLNFVLWAISVALKADSTEIPHPGGSHISLTISSEEEICEDSLASKLLRWLVASVIHGELSDRSTYTDAKYSERSDLKMLNSLLQFVKETSRGRSRKTSGTGKVLAAAILYLQQLLGTDCRVLPSVVSALCLLLYDFCDIAVTESDLLLDGTPVASQLSKISCPLEANPAWRWSFYQPWKDLSSEGTDSERLDEYQACQTLLLVISNTLRTGPSNSLALSPRDVERCGVYEWERSIIESSLCTD
ncbi:uncharacterized protein LOC130134424 isoform X1 [Syzygium oleosum]|uniref:uncharacterized protein LOC130134424 isoform X1 n=1 Tax=Syzygium oleosum TaxID=219896 RepID=UPI0024BBB8AA|nr:uncharacterized protein LOC130134424 isoform X1 [Syzygium oleosum]